MEFPNAAVEINPAWLLTLGLTVGVLSGFFGVGGGFLVTGGLIVIGVPEFFAVGTGLALIMGTSTINALKHRKMGHVDLRLGLYIIIGTIPGVEAAKRLLLYLESHGLEGDVISYVYVVVLAALGTFILYDYHRSRTADGDPGDRSSTGALIKRVRSIKLGPMVSLPVAGIPSISLWVLVAIGLAVGFFAGLLGAGGGFLLMPVMVFVLGVPTITAVGTDLFQVVITGSFGTLTYALENKVDLLMAMIMLGAASMGSQLGTMASSLVDGARIRFLYGITILAGSGALALDQIAEFSDNLDFLSTVGAALLLGVAGLMCGVIALLAMASISRKRQEASLPLGSSEAD